VLTHDHEQIGADASKPTPLLLINLKARRRTTTTTTLSPLPW
jgi:hypothetical protein